MHRQWDVRAVAATVCLEGREDVRRADLVVVHVPVLRRNPVSSLLL